MAKATAGKARGTRRKPSNKSAGGGMMPWYGAAVLVLAGIVAYDHRDDIARLMPDKPAAKTASRETATRPPVPATRAPSTGSAAAKPSAPLPPMSIPSSPPQPSAKPMLASLPPAAIPSSAASGSMKMVGAGFKGPFYYCGRSGLNNCIAESGVFWHDKTAIRLADVDIPGAESAKCDAERQRGFRAKVRLRELLDAGPFELVLSDNGDREQAGAKLRVAMRNGQSIGDQLVREGLARPKGGNGSPWC